MNIEDVAKTINEISQDVATIKAEQKHYNENISALQPLAEQVVELNANLKNLVVQVRDANGSMARMFESTDKRLTRHGERIGPLESSVEKHGLIIDKLAKRMDDSESDIKEIKMKGSKRWDGIVEKIVYVAVGAAVMFLLYQIGIG